MTVLRVRSHEGDTLVACDTPAMMVGDAADAAALREAETFFEDHLARGGIWVHLAPDGSAEVVERFDARLGELIGLPRIVGG